MNFAQNNKIYILRDAFNVSYKNENTFLVRRENDLVWMIQKMSYLTLVEILPLAILYENHLFRRVNFEWEKSATTT